MSLASLYVTPSGINLNVPISESAGVLNPIYLSIAPNNPSTAALFDFTGATAATLNFDNGLAQTNAAYASSPCSTTMVTHDATGLIIEATAANLLTSLIAVGGLVAGPAAGSQSTGRLSISVTDGTNTCVVATGVWSVSQTA